MTREVIKRETAQQDLEDHFVYIGKDNLEAAERFLKSAEKTFNELVKMPEMGPSRNFKNPALGGIRSWRISGFENYLIFYRPIESGIEIIRVLHGARDIERLFQTGPES